MAAKLAALNAEIADLHGQLLRLTGVYEGANTADRPAIRAKMAKHDQSAPIPSLRVRGGTRTRARLNVRFQSAQ